jgi:N4-gp56 family major capsid protein
MEANATTMSVLTPKMVAKAVTKMKKDKVPTINGYYVAVVHPSVSHMLRESNEWIDLHKYSATAEIFTGEIGTLHGCRFIESADTAVCGGEKYVNKAGGVTYPTFFFGKDAFAIIDPEGGALEMIVKDKSQVGGPLDQYSTINLTVA